MAISCSLPISTFLNIQKNWRYVNCQKYTYIYSICHYKTTILYIINSEQLGSVQAVKNKKASIN